MPAIVHPWLQVVRDEDRVETDFFCQDRELKQFAWSELLGGGCSRTELVRS
jgi:hypothetical protein